MFSLFLLVGALDALPTQMRAVKAVGSAPAKDFSKVELETVKVPKPGLGQALIQVKASSVNPVDWKLLEEGQMRPFFFPKTLGFDVSGTVAAVGMGCARLAVGDDVWADLGKLHVTGLELGAWAEYAVADCSQVGLKPTALSFAEAGALPLVGLTSLQALRKAGAPWRNATVVVTSGAGGTGLVGLQLAKALGATRVVTAASPANFAVVKQFGATDVVDYHSESLWAALGNNSVDVVYDNLGLPGTADAAMPSLKTGGVFVFLPGKGGALSKHPKPGVKQVNYGLCDSSKHEDLDFLKDLAEKGELSAHVQQVFPLEDVPKALALSAAGHVVGKLGITTNATDAPTSVLV